MMGDMGRNVYNRCALYIALIVVPIIIFTVAFLAMGQHSPDMRPKVGREDKKMTSFTREEIRRRAAKLGNPVLTTLERSETVVEQIPTEYFSNGAIYRVSTRPPDRPRVYNLGVWGTDGIEILNNEPEHFFDLAAKSGLTLRSGSDHVAYVTTFIEVTRDFTGGVQVLNTIEESWWLPSPSPEEARKREEIIAKYAKLVESPKISRDSSTTVVIYLIRDRALICMHAKVESDGRMEFREDVLVAEMPTVMLR